MVLDAHKKYQKKLSMIDDELKAERQKIIKELHFELEAEIHRKVASGMMTKAAAEKKWKHEMESVLKNHDFLCMIFKGFDTIEHHAKSMLTAEERVRLKEELYDCIEKIQHLKEAKNETVSTIQELYGVSDFLMHCFHRIGYELYKKERWEESKSVYVLLTCLNQSVPEFYAALAAIEDRLGNLNGAIGLAAMAVTLDKDNPRNHILYANLLIENGDRLNAKDEIAVAEQLLHGTSRSHHKEDIEDLQILKKELAHA